MLKLPVCPHCKTVFYYGDVIKLARQKKCKCYQCDKNFRVLKWKGRIIFYLIFAVIMCICNALLMHITDAKTAIPMIIFTVICVILSLFALPFTVKFK